MFGCTDAVPMTDPTREPILEGHTENISGYHMPEPIAKHAKRLLVGLFGLGLAMTVTYLFLERPKAIGATVVVSLLGFAAYVLGSLILLHLERSRHL